MTEPSHVLIAGITTRALAVSAARAGHRVTAIDAFGDLDLRAVADVIGLRSKEGKRFGPAAAAAAGDTVPAGVVAYTSNLENYPAAVARLSRGRQLLGNAPDVLGRVRNPIELMRLLRREGFATPETRASPVEDRARSRAWLLKPRRSGGGHAIRIWQPGTAVSRSRYLQERIPGIPGSIVFVADGRNAVVLGMSRQLVGESRLGAHGFRYCGSLLGSSSLPVLPHHQEVLVKATAIVEFVSREFGLIGLNGIDFIAHEGVPYPVEVNPRFSASMELVERAGGLSLFQVHAGGCRGTLPVPPRPSAKVQGKAIVFARRDVTLGDTGEWIGSRWVADVPHPGERIGRGHPICTVLAEGKDARACRSLLLRRAAAVHRTTSRREAA